MGKGESIFATFWFSVVAEDKTDYGSTATGRDACINSAI